MGETEKELGGPTATNPFAQMIDEAEGLDKIEDLQVGGVGGDRRQAGVTGGVVAWWIGGWLAGR